LPEDYAFAGEIYAAVDQSFTEPASVLQRFQPVNSMQDFLSPLGYEGRVY
jgi:hypothetical protein